MTGQIAGLQRRRALHTVHIELRVWHCYAGKWIRERTCTCIFLRGTEKLVIRTLTRLEGGYLTHIFLILRKEEAYEITSLSVCPLTNLLHVYSLSAGTLSRSRYIETAVSCGPTIPAFRRNVTLHSKVIGRGVFYKVRVVSNTQYVAKGKWVINSSQNFL
jgi:hypothetical protein